MKKCIYLFAVVCLIFSCNPKTKTSSDATEKSEVEIKDSTDLYLIDVKYPVVSFDSANVIKEFVEQLVADKKEEWKTDGDVYKGEMEIRKEFPDRADIKYGFWINYESFTSQKYNATSYLFHVYTYTGGANGDDQVNTFTFKDGKKIDITDVLDIENNNDIAITRLIVKAALQQDTIEYDKSFLNDGLGLSYLKADGITVDKTKCNCDGYFFGSNLQNFVISDTGIIFNFDKGAIAAVAVGTPQIKLTWEELKPYVKSSFQ